MNNPEENIRNAIKTAADIYRLVSNSYVSENTSVESRYNMCLEKYKSFAQAFPVVLAKMVIENRYNETAFLKFLEKIQKNPGKGIEGLMSSQADYAKMLYIEECKAVGRKWSAKRAKDIWEQQYRELEQKAKDVKRQEEAARSEYEENEKKYLVERRAELLEYLKTIDPTEYVDEVNELLDLHIDDEPEPEAPAYSNLTVVQEPTEVTQEVYESVQPRLETYVSNAWVSHLSNTPKKRKPRKPSRR